MATFSSMADEVIRKLSGFTLRQDRQTHLTSAISATDTVIYVGNAENISQGLIQIGDELIYADSFDRTTGVINVPPYGRGTNGTTPTSHAVGSKVIIAPSFPLRDIKDSINDTIQAVYPDLYAKGVHTFKYTPAKLAYALPDEARRVLSVSYETVGPSKEWYPVRNWRVDANANTAAFNSSKSIVLNSGIQPGRTVQVVYTATPSLLEANTDDFELTTGLPPSCKDVIIFGAAWRSASFIDTGRLSFGSAEADQQSQIAGRAYGAGTNAAKYLLAVYQQRLAEEARKLKDSNPTRVHLTR